MTTATADRFKNRKEALLWLQQRGQISTGKFYQDCQDGKITVHPDKTISRFEVMQYAEKVFGFVRQTAPAFDMEEKKRRYELDKLEAESRSAKIKADDAERSLDSKWMLREEHEEQMAAFAGLLEDAFRHRCYLDNTELLLTAGGDQNRSSEFAHAMQRFCDRSFNDAAGHKEIELEFIEEDEND